VIEDLEITRKLTKLVSFKNASDTEKKNNQLVIEDLEITRKLTITVPGRKSSDIDKKTKTLTGI